jgi:hypothetical protein
LFLGHYYYTLGYKRKLLQHLLDGKFIRLVTVISEVPTYV